jgi:Kef-type K+ transport system membrane component KefB
MVNRITTFTCEPCYARTTHPLIEGLGMAYLNGTKRIKRLGLCVAVLGDLIALLLWCTAALLHSDIPISYGVIVTMIAFPVFVGTVIYAFGWFIEGFLRPSAKDR